MVRGAARVSATVKSFREVLSHVLSYIQKEMHTLHRLHTETTRSSDYLLKTVLSYIQKEMHKLHTETTRSSDYLLKTVLRVRVRDLRPALVSAVGVGLQLALCAL